MISAAKVSKSLIAGLAAGVAGWLFFMMLFILFPSHGMGVGLRSSGLERLFATFFGAALGFSLGVVEGINTGSIKQMQRALLAYSIAGFLGGFVGLFVGQIVYGIFLGLAFQSVSFLSFFIQLLGRSLAWGLWGVGTGVLFGLAIWFVSGSYQRGKLAAIGGALGGLLGGFLFQLLNDVRLFPYALMTLVSFLCIAAGVAFFQALAQELFKQAWVRVLAGRNEGREFQIAKPLTIIGRDEYADIPLFGDMQISKRHAVIKQSGSVNTIEAAAAGLSVLVNGQSVSSTPLKDGDTITIASRQLQFHTKGGRSRAAYSAAQPSVQAAPPVQVPSGGCPFCGQIKDTSGGCGCSVGAGEPIPMQPASVSQPTQMYSQPASAPPSFSMDRTLQVTAGILAGQTFSLSEGQTLTIGRLPEATISVPSDNFMSRQHAQVSMINGAVSVRDMGSSNGTLVNGQRIMEQILQPGDVIQIGETQIRIG